MYISTHIYYWPTRHSKTIHPRALRLSISGALFSVVSLFETIMAPEIQIDFCIANGHAGCNMMSFDNSVKNKPDIFRLITFKRVKKITIENNIISAFLRLCNISLVKFQCPSCTFLTLICLK